MKRSKMNALAHKRRHGNKSMNKEHRRRGQHAYRKRHAYSPQREARSLQREEDACKARQQRLNAYCEQARTLTKAEDIRALYQDVWKNRHNVPAAVTWVDRIIKNRRASGELPNPYIPL